MGEIVAAYAAYAALAAAAVSGAIQYKTSEDTKDAQEEYNEYLTQDAIRQYGELDKAESDAIYESHAESMEAQRQFMEARSTVQLNAAVTGTYGNSVNLALQDLNTGLGGRMADITYKRESQLNAIDQQAERIQANPASQANRTVTAPSYLSAFSSALSTGSSVYKIGQAVGKSGSES